MYVVTDNIGFRELYRLISFCNYMLEYHHSELTDVTIEYDLHYDEPCIAFGFSRLYATDYNIGFDESGNAVEL